MPLTRWSRRMPCHPASVMFGTVLRACGLGIQLDTTSSQQPPRPPDNLCMDHALHAPCLKYALGQLGTSVLRWSLCFGCELGHLHTPIIFSWHWCFGCVRPFCALCTTRFLKNKTQWACTAFACVCYALPLLLLQHPIWFAHGHTLLAALHDDRALPKLLSPINGSILATVTKIMPYLLSHFGFHLTFAYVAASVPVMLLLWGLCQHILRLLDRQQHFDVCFGLMTCALLDQSSAGNTTIVCYVPLVLAGLRYLAFPVAIVPYCLGIALFV